MSEPINDEIVARIERNNLIECGWVRKGGDLFVADIRALIASWRERGEALKELQEASSVLLDEAEGFNISGVYFNEPCMGHKGPSLVRSACDRARAAYELMRREK